MICSGSQKLHFNKLIRFLRKCEFGYYALIPKLNKMYLVLWVVKECTDDNAMTLK